LDYNISIGTCYLVVVYIQHLVYALVMICQRLGGLPILVLALSMMSTIDEVLADLSIRLSPFLPTGALTDSIFRR